MEKIDIEKFLGSLIEGKSILDSFRDQGLDYSWEEKKIIPKGTKYKASDWVVSEKSGEVYLVDDIKDGHYYISDISGKLVLNSKDVFESSTHLWTLEDVKVGDILSGDPGFIMKVAKCRPSSFGWRIKSEYYVYQDKDGKHKFSPIGIYHTADKLHPATKEEQEILTNFTGYINTDYLPPSFSSRLISLGYKGDMDGEKISLSCALKWFRECRGIYIMINRITDSWAYLIVRDGNYIQEESCRGRSWKESGINAIEYLLR